MSSSKIARSTPTGRLVCEDAQRDAKRTRNESFWPWSFAIFSAYLAAFTDYEVLRQRVLFVLTSLPALVQRDFLDDPRFSIALDDFEPGKGWTLLVPCPGPGESVSRCVVLRRNLAECSEAFALYVIAHEFAHAYLRNGGWGAITDVEDAADALAASWGFQRPVRSR